jgi:hypothetical protein
MRKFFSIIILFTLSFVSCLEEPPVSVEGNTYFEMTASWYSIPTDTTSELLPMSNATVIFSSEYGIMVKNTDSEGKLIITGLPSSKYAVSCRMKHPEDESIQLIYNQKDIMIISGVPVIESVIAKPVSSSGIAINEIYCGGPLNNIFFFYDQYIEIYNLSDSVKYLDGMMIMRFSGNSDTGEKGPGADEDDDDDIDGAVYIFKFPGLPGEKNIPFEPRSFITMASDAVNHQATVSTSIDLSNANWEFYNQFSSTDIDNPNVPNLINIRSDRTVDFLINLVSDVIILSSGVDSVWEDGIDISTVIDGVEYQSSPNVLKTLDDRVDRGFALSPPKYSGQSMQRREPGSDTNDGTLDWEILPAPTPGYHK